MLLLIIDLDNPIYLFLLFGIGILSVIAITNYYSDKNKIARALKKIDAKRIATIKENEYAKVIGKAQILDCSIISPIGRRKCVYYQIKIDKKTGQKNQTWRTIIEKEEYIPFIINADGEKAIIKDIDPKNKLVHLAKDVKKRSGTFNDPPPHLEEFLKSYGESSTGFLGFNRGMRYHEGIIEIDEEIAIMGIGHWKKTDHNFDRYSSDTLHLYGDKVHKLLITDDPKVISQQ